MSGLRYALPCKTTRGPKTNYDTKAAEPAADPVLPRQWLSVAGPRWVCAGSVHDLCALQITCSCHVITHRQHRPRIASPLASSFSPPPRLSPPRLSPFPDLLHREIGLAQPVLSPAAITPFCAPTAAPPRARGRGRAVGACVQIAVTCAGDVTVCGVIKV